MYNVRLLKMLNFEFREYTIDISSLISSLLKYKNYSGNILKFKPFVRTLSL